MRKDFDKFEVIVCDDGSTDNTVPVVETYYDFLNISNSYGENFWIQRELEIEE